MAYPNDNKLNVIIAQTSASADGTGKFPFTERIISGSNLFIITNTSGELIGSTSIPSATFDNLLVTGAITASIISASTALTSAAATFTGPVSMSSTLSASGIYDSGILTVIGVTNLTNVTASGNMLFSGSPSYLNGTNLVISASGANFTGHLGSNTLTVSSSIVDGGSLTVLGNTVLGDALTDTLQVTGSTSLTGSFSVVGSISGSSLTITGNSNLTTITGALSGSSVSTGNATINGGNINNTVIGGTTPAAGTFTTLIATGNTLLGDATSDFIRVTGSLSVSGSLSVVGPIIGTVETASKVVVTNLPNANSTYYVTFVENTGSAQSILTDSNVISYNPLLNRVTVGNTSGSLFISNDSGGNINGIALYNNNDNGGATIQVGLPASNETASLYVGKNTNGFRVLTGQGVNTGVITELPVSASDKILFSNTTNATSWTNGGALTVGGGVGIGKDLHVSGSTFLYGDLTIYGSSSIVNISSSTIIIGDNRILLNAASPIMRYAGIDVYDSGSGGIQSNVTSSFVWDSLTDNWIIFSANSGSGTYTTASSILIGGPLSKFGNEGTLTVNTIPKVQSSGKNITDSLLSDNGTTLSYTGTGISASQITSSNVLYTNLFSTNISSSIITASNALLTNVYSNYISSSVISSSNLRVDLTGNITYATGVLVTYITGSFNTLTLSTGSFPGNAPGLVPNTPTSSGMPGQINVDNNFIYVYTNQVWKRVPLSQWLN